MKKIIIKVDNGIGWKRIEIDLDQLEADGTYETEDDLGWDVHAYLE